MKLRRRIEALGTIQTAERVKVVIGQIFKYAIATERAENSPMTVLAVVLESRERMTRKLQPMQKMPQSSNQSSCPNLEKIITVNMNKILALIQNAIFQIRKSASLFKFF